ncbi:MAG: methyltransferase domain-containing protein [Candidatus Aminicenantales bacterium]
MRRTLEKLAQERQEKEQELARRLAEIKQKGPAERLAQATSSLGNMLTRLKDILKKEQEKAGLKKALLSRRTKLSAEEIAGSPFHELVFLLLREHQSLLLQNLELTKELYAGLTDLVGLQGALADAKDREWDALGSNHVGLIFKSLEWRVDKLSAESEDAKLLMKKFILLREKLDRLLAVLEEKKAPQPEDVRALLTPLEDWSYAGFENRFRGGPEDVKKQLRKYLPYFSKNGPVLDLGCGRGEFLELLREKGIEAEGVDINGQMVDICLDKGLHCRKGEILENLAGRTDGSLGGIFSSQVIEHLPPAYLKKLIEISLHKLGGGSTLILETVNPLSVFALVQVYYLDPSHRNPIHPQALKFMLETAGYEDVEITFSSPLESERLQPLPGADEHASVFNRNIDSLNDLLFAPVNYAAVARKK